MRAMPFFKYLSFFRIRFLMTLQYRAAALSGVITQFVWGLLEIMMFRAFYEADPAAFPMTLDALTSYIWLQQAFLSLYAGWVWESDLFESIRSGNIAYELCRPASPYCSWFIRTTANRSARAALRCLPILLISVFLQEGFRLILPDSLARIGWFLVSMLLALIVVVSFQMLVYGITFFLMNSMGIRIVVQTLTDFLCGAVIPLPFLPDSIQGILSVLPFASMQNAPFRIYSGDISGGAVYTTVLLQLFWAVALILSGSLLMRKGLGKIVIQGG